MMVSILRIILCGNKLRHCLFEQIQLSFGFYVCCFGLGGVLNLHLGVCRGSIRICTYFGSISGRGLLASVECCRLRLRQGHIYFGFRLVRRRTRSTSSKHHVETRYYRKTISPHGPQSAQEMRTRNDPSMRWLKSYRTQRVHQAYSIDLTRLDPRP